MPNGLISQPSNRSATTFPSIGCLALACFLGLGLIGCSDASSEASSEDQTISSDSQVNTASTASSAVFDAALEETPCEIVPKELVAKTFNVPADQLEVSDAGSSTCAYDWKGDKEMLEVSLGVDVFDTAEAASSNFRSVTRGMSAKEVSDAMDGIVNKATEKVELDSGTKQGAAKQLSSAVGGKGLHFEDVEGVADEARFGTRFGTLYVRQGNLQLRLSAYHGHGMMPSEPGKSIMTAIKEWQKETMSARKRQSAELAKAIVAAL